MSTLTFYRQARRDGGVRTGIEINSNTVLARFEQGSEDGDPALVWYVDVRCEGARLPAEPEAARAWFIRNESAITRLLEALADEVPSGIDPGDWPLRKEHQLSTGVRVTVACSAMRRVEGQQIAQVLRDIAANWRERVSNLPQVER